MGWIDSVRKKPREVRGQYAFLIAAVLTGFIALVWVVSLPERFNAIGTAVATEPPSPTEAGSFFGTVGEQFGNAKDSVARALDAFRDTDEVAAEPAATASVNEIDIDTLLRESAAEASAPAKPIGQVILIATSSSQRATSTP